MANLIPDTPLVMKAEITRLERELETTQRERDEENRQKRQLHLVYMMTVEQLAQALGMNSIEGFSTQDLIEKVAALRAASAEMCDAFQDWRERSRKGSATKFARVLTADKALKALLGVQDE